MIGGRYDEPITWRDYRKYYHDMDLCPAITATEYAVGRYNSATDSRRAGRYYGRRLTIEECAYHQGFDIPEDWMWIPDGYTNARWLRKLYNAIGNGVPVYMAESFGRVYECA